MLHLLCDPLERTTVSTIESEYEVKSTYDLIVRLRSRVQLYEATKFIVVCDSVIMKDFLSLNRAHAEELLQSTDVDFCVILNNSNDIQQEEKNILEHPNNANKNISFLTINTIDESIRSTNARIDINNAQDLLPQCVFEYIQQNNISFI